MVDENAERRLAAELHNNTRINISGIARRIGLSYAAVRNRLMKLIRNDLLGIKPVVSPRILGNIGGIVRIKSRNPYRIVSMASRCNKVIGILEINHEEVVLLLYSRSKHELAYTVDRLISYDDGVKEYAIEYGKIPNELKIPLRNPSPDCGSCPFYINGLCTGCLPILRLRNRVKKG